MTDTEKILDAMRKLYEQAHETQNLVRQSLTRIEAVEKSVGTVESTHRNSQGKRPWESGWSKDKVDEPEAPDTVKDTFKL